MNIDTGQIMQLTDDQKALLDKMGTRIVSIDESLRTERERITGKVLLSDKTALGEQLRAERSKFMPHVGAKQLAKLARG
jgi:hypothetical protein